MIERATSFLCVPMGALLLLASLALPARATTMPERTAAEVAAESELVVEATVTSTKVVRLGGRIVTVRELRIEQVLRNNLPHAAPAPLMVTLALPGGELGGIGQRVAGTPDLAVGARYLLCLSAPLWNGARTVVGLWQGAWRVDHEGALRPFQHYGEAPVALPRASLLAALRGQP